MGRAKGLRTAAVVPAIAYLAAAAWMLWWVLVAAVVPGWTPVAITSGSMEPVIRTGDVVVAAAVDDGQLGEGAVVVFDSGERGLVTHRISGVADDGTYRTKGDANAVHDSATVASDAVLGRGRLLVPAVGRPLVWFQHERWGLLAGWAVATLGAWLAVTWWWRSAEAIVPRAGAQREPTERERALIAFAWAGAEP